MRDFDQYLGEKLKDPEFARGFEHELRFARLAMGVAGARTKLGMSQTALARLAGVTQQQLSKLEFACPCNVTTLMKVCDALGLELALRPKRTGSAVTVTPAKPRRSRAKSVARPKRRAAA